MASSIQIYITWIKVFIELEIPIELKWNKHKINQLLFCIEIAIRNRSVWYVSHSFEEVDFNEYSNMNSPPFYWKMTIDAVLINLKYAKESRQFGNSNLRFPELFLLIIDVWTVESKLRPTSICDAKTQNMVRFFFKIVTTFSILMCKSTL